MNFFHLLRPSLSLTCDLLTLKLIVSCHCGANLHQNRYIRFQNIVFTSVVIDERDEQTNIQVKIMPPASLASGGTKTIFNYK